MTRLSLRHAVRRAFAPTTATAATADAAATPATPSASSADRAATRAAYHRDLVRPFGLELTRDTATLDLPGPSYGEMGRALLAAAVPAHEPVDLLVLAYAVPDLEPGRATATYLSHVCPGRPLAFAISDQGTAAAFTGLRLISEYARSGDIRRAVLLVLEQPTLPYDPGVPVALPTEHNGVALVLEAGEGDGLLLTSVSVEPGVAHPEPPNPGSDFATDPRPDREPGRDLDLGPDGRASDGTGDATTVLLGAGFSSADTRPCTGVWWQLIGLLSLDELPAKLLLADLDPVSRSVCLAEFRTRA